MRIDCHVHVSAFTPAHGSMSPTILRSLPFRFMRWRLGIRGEDEATERAIEAKLAQTVNETCSLDKAVILAFDSVYEKDGSLAPQRTHLHVTNDYVIELCQRHPKMLFGASVHPYRRDAVKEIERCAKAGAVLMKWLPLVQDMDPSDDRCIPFYEALAHYKIPLLSHTGGEKTLQNVNTSVLSPQLLTRAIECGVTVIAAHCGTRSAPQETSYLSTFVRMAREHERFYGDTAALCLPTRSYAFETLLADKDVNRKLVHGSDWPVISLPPAMSLRPRDTIRLLADRNWLRRDVNTKKVLGFDDAYFNRAATILRLKGA
jgi:uncharacterized protein